MIRVAFKDLQRSKLIEDAIEKKVADDVQRFSGLDPKSLRFTVSMENSPFQSGPDFFKIRLVVVQGPFKGIVLEKSASSFYSALAELNEAMLERLNRFSKKRISNRRKKVARKISA